MPLGPRAAVARLRLGFIVSPTPHVLEGALPFVSFAKGRAPPLGRHASLSSNSQPKILSIPSWKFLSSTTMPTSANSSRHSGLAVNVRADLDPNGFGDHTPLLHAVNSNQNRCRPVMELLADSGANLDIRLKGLVWGSGFESETLLFDITPSLTPNVASIFNSIAQRDRSTATSLIFSASAIPPIPLFAMSPTNTFKTHASSTHAPNPATSCTNFPLPPILPHFVASLPLLFCLQQPNLVRLTHLIRRHQPFPIPRNIKRIIHPIKSQSRQYLCCPRRQRHHSNLHVPFRP